LDDAAERKVARSGFIVLTSYCSAKIDACPTLLPLYLNRSDNKLECWAGGEVKNQMLFRESNEAWHYLLSEEVSFSVPLLLQFLAVLNTKIECREVFINIMSYRSFDRLAYAVWLEW